MTSGAPRDGLGESIVRSVADTAALEVASDWAEIGLDELLDEGILEKVPVLAHARALWKTGRQVSDLLFARKLVRFLSQLGEISSDKRQAFSEEMRRDPELRERVGEHVLLLLDRADDLRKPQLLAAAFARCIAGKWDFQQFQEAAHAIDRCLLADLQLLSTEVVERPNAFDEGVGGVFLQVEAETGGAAARLAGAGVVERATGGYCLTLAGTRIRQLLASAEVAPLFQ